MANKEVIYDLDAAAFCSDDFRMYQFKVSGQQRHSYASAPLTRSQQSQPVLSV